MAETTHSGGDSLDPTALSPEDATRVLTVAYGRQVGVEMVRAAIEAGAPALPDGRVNLLDLAAWLERETAGRR